jgi:hypothetical protein
MRSGHAVQFFTGITRQQVLPELGFGSAEQTC